MTGPTWQSITIEGKPADAFAPPGAKFALLFLHPHGDETLADPVANPDFTIALTEAGLACCCPYASHTWWSDKNYPPFDDVLTAEQHLLRNVVPWMRSTWNLNDRAMAVAGISMGGQGALRFAFRHADQFPVVASIAGAIDFHQRFDDPDFAELPRLYRSQEQCRQDTATLRVNQASFPRHIWFASDPRDQVWHPGNDRLHEKLRAVGVPHIADLETSRGGHGWDYFKAMAKPMMEFVLAALAKESRRLM